MKNIIENNKHKESKKKECYNNNQLSKMSFLINNKKKTKNIIFKPKHKNLILGKIKVEDLKFLKKVLLISFS